MKKNLSIYLLIPVLILFANELNARAFYVAPNGNDNNAGTISAPYRTLDKLSTVMAPGDTAYVRGGTYRINKAASVDNRVYIQNLHGTSANHIVITNYPGENPVFNLDDVICTGFPAGMYIQNCDWIDVIGLRVTGLSSAQAQSLAAGWVMSNVQNFKVERCEMDNSQSYGFITADGSTDGLWLNCDAHHLQDPPDYGGSNGFMTTGGDQSTRITYRGCRAWWISDDGFDLYSVNGLFYYENCWSFWNGYIPGTFNTAGDGMGFKFGPANNNQSGNTLRFVSNCLAFENRLFGFDQNAGTNNTCRFQMYNNTAYNNGSTGFFFGANTSIQQNFKNNISNTGVNGSEITSGPNIRNNSWNGGVTLSNADFLSVNSAGVNGPRQADGSLPNLNFLKLITASDLIDAGINVSMPYNGTAPDLGAYEAGGAAPPINQPPVANAGANQTITLPIATVTLTGSGTDADGTIASYQWTKIAGPTSFTIVSPILAQTVINSLAQGVYQFELRVTDNLGAIDRDTVQITVNPGGNQLPVANAGANQTITLPANTVTLTGSGTDADGSIASYQWTKIAGPASFTIVSPILAQTVINSLAQGVYQFELRVTDNLGAIGRDTVQITVNAPPNQPPSANAGANQTITLPTNTVTLTGSGTDADGSIASYQWTKIAGPTQFTIVSVAQAQTVVNNLVQGTYRFELRVTDNLGAIGRDTVQVTVNPGTNQPPAANAGSNQTIILPTNTVTLTGSGIDADGNIASYLWTKIAGPTQFTIVSSAQAQTAVNNLAQGVYQFELRVTDNQGAIGRDTVTVTVNAAPNQPPIANAGTNQTISLPVNTITLTGSGSDADGNIASYQWTKVAGPAQFTIVAATQAQTAVNNLAQGVYQFELRVTDNVGAVDRDTVRITVNAAPPANQPPIASAGPNQTITLPVNVVGLSGSGTDADGTIASYQWTKVSGPAQFTIVSPTQSQTIVNNLAQGIYQFELRVTDNLGATDNDTVRITVNAAPNQVPAVNAGPNQIITLPTSTVTLSGIGIDIDGSITAYQWTKVAGPTQFTVVSSAQSQTAVNNLVQGVYRFELRVTDNLGAFGRDTVQVTVNAAPPNQPPTANAGANQTITLPVNSVIVTGSGADADGTIASYQWTKIAGPAQFTILFPTQAQTVINNLVQGVYQFELRVTDNTGAAARDTMQVTVNAAAPSNQAPVANAGSDQSILLPVNSVTQNGGGVDPDGSIASYQWRKLTGPTQFAIVSPAQAQTVINNLVQGVYQFELRVTDNNGVSDRDTMQLTVYAPVPPVANAGADQVISFPGNSGLLTGSGTANSGQSITSYQWTKIAGPAQYTIVSPDQAQTEFTNLVLGVYQFELTITDNIGLTDKDTVLIEISDQVTLIQLYPNPTVDFIDISISSSNYSSPSRIAIYNSEGKAVYKEQLTRTQAVTIKNIDVSRLANGLYILEVIIDTKTKKTIKFIKQ